MKKIAEYCAVYSAGAAAYSLIEILWRGFTHWTMALTGGLCLTLIYAVDGAYESTPLWKRCAAGSLIITLAELAVGFTVNTLLHWNVWDYSERRLNFHGLICPLYTFLWFLLCIPANFVCDGIRKLFSKFSRRA